MKGARRIGTTSTRFHCKINPSSQTSGFFDRSSQSGRDYAGHLSSTCSQMVGWCLVGCPMSFNFSGSICQTIWNLTRLIWHVRHISYSLQSLWSLHYNTTKSTKSFRHYLAPICPAWHSRFLSKSQWSWKRGYFKASFLGILASYELKLRTLWTFSQFRGIPSPTVVSSVLSYSILWYHSN